MRIFLQLTSWVQKGFFHLSASCHSNPEKQGLHLTTEPESAGWFVTFLQVFIVENYWLTLAGRIFFGTPAIRIHWLQYVSAKNLFSTIDASEPCCNFALELKKLARVGQVFEIPIQNFSPPSGRYSLIWNQVYEIHNICLRIPPSLSSYISTKNLRLKWCSKNFQSFSFMCQLLRSRLYQEMLIVFPSAFANSGF